MKKYENLYKDEEWEHLRQETKNLDIKTVRDLIVLIHSRRKKCKKCYNMYLKFLTTKFFIDIQPKYKELREMELE